MGKEDRRRARYIKELKYDDGRLGSLFHSSFHKTHVQVYEIQQKIWGWNSPKYQWIYGSQLDPGVIYSYGLPT